MKDREAIAEILERSASDAGLRGAVELGVDAAQLRRALDSGGARLESGRGLARAPASDELEAIVRLHARPSLLVTDGERVAAESDVWRRRLAPHSAALARAMTSVGRVDLCNHATFDWVGTAWVIAENTVVTNRHVVEEFAQEDGERWLFARQSDAGDITADIDFIARHGSSETHRVRVARIHWVWHGPGPSADLALLQLEGDGIPAPIPIADHDGAQDRFVAVVGYPARDSRNEDAVMARIFDNQYGVKRLAPGQITRVADNLRFEHDCSTLGGNSGSVVLDIETGHALGLHFGGTFRKANFAVRASVIRDALARAQVQVAAPFEPTVRGADSPLADDLQQTVQAARASVDDAFGRVCARARDATAPLPVAEARRLLEVLRDDGRHAELVELGDLIVAGGQGHPIVCRLLAQGQLERGALDAAIATLDRAARELAQRLQAAGDPARASEALWLRAEQAEVQGLLGRAYKQRYVDAGPTREEPRTEDAQRALDCYGSTYAASPVSNLWHGINFVALSHHRLRVTRTTEDARDSEADRVAEDILRNVDLLDEIGDTTIWDEATRAEALLSLGRHDEFTAAVDKFIARADLTRFAVGSFRRQLRQVWQLNEGKPPGQRVLPVLDQRWDAVGVKSEPQPELRAPAKAAVRAVVDDNRAGRRARGVARIGSSFHDGEGSGFLLDPRAIWPEYEGPRNVFLLTNAHVCSPDAAPFEDDGPLHPRAARFAFLGPKGRVDREVLVAYSELLWSSPPGELDATLLLLDGGPSVEPYPMHAGEPQRGEVASVVGYPLGGGLWYSTEENVVGEVDERCLLYSTKTEPGMSGSPVFDAQWQLIALHRHYNSERGLNGGVRIDRIVAAIRAALASEFGNRGPSPYLDPARGKP